MPQHSGAVAIDHRGRLRTSNLDLLPLSVRPALLRGSLSIFYERDDIRNIPKPVGHARSHSGRHAVDGRRVDQLCGSLPDVGG